MLFPPKAYLIGAQKAGTTTLAYLLGQHSHIEVSDPKEPHYFSFNWERGEDWYRSCFHTWEANVFMDASTSYSMGEVKEEGVFKADDVVPRRIASMRPDARFIYVLRNPVDRAYSAYWHRVRRGWERQGFCEAMQADPRYVDASCYVAQLRAYLEHFDIQAFHFVNFVDLVEDPARETRRCLEFLGIEAGGYTPSSNRAKNQSFQYTSVGLFIRRLFGDETRLKSLSNVVRKLVPESGHKYLKSVLAKEVPKITEKERSMVAGLIGSANEGLSDYAGFEFKN